MFKLDLHEEVSGFQQLFKTLLKLLEYSRKLGITDDHLTICLCKFYAIWNACQIQKCLMSLGDLETASSEDEDEICLDSGEMLPDHETVQQSAQDLLLAASSRDKAATKVALRDMGVLALCPTPEEVFPAMENVASRVNGPAQQVFLVDLSLFAAESGDYQRAHKYIQQARSFHPSSRELYNICVIEGLIALNAGKLDEAIQFMDNSTTACQADVDSSIQCSLLPPNLDLAEKLFELGERVAVLRYLTECHNVWQNCRSQIEEWIHVIERGETPDFHTLEMPVNTDQLSYRLNVQWLRACSLELQVSPAKSKTLLSTTQVLAERERRKAKYGARMSAHIRNKLEYLEKDLAVLPDQLPPDIPGPDQPR
jgi:hypothetical protein